MSTVILSCKSWGTRLIICARFVRIQTPQPASHTRCEIADIWETTVYSRATIQSRSNNFIQVLRHTENKIWWTLFKWKQRSPYRLGISSSTNAFSTSTMSAADLSLCEKKQDATTSWRSTGRSIWNDASLVLGRLRFRVTKVTSFVH